jgi:ankyrin repeat protein
VRRDAEAAAADAQAAAADAKAKAAEVRERVMVRALAPHIRILSGGAEDDGLNRALATTAEKGDANAVKALLKAGADASAVSPARDAPVVLAVRSGDAATVRALLDAGASADTRSRDGATLLSIAGSLGHRSVERLLKSRGAKD